MDKWEERHKLVASMVSIGKPIEKPKIENSKIPIENGRFEISEINDFINNIRDVYGPSGQKSYSSIQDLESKCLNQLNSIHSESVGYEANSK